MKYFKILNNMSEYDNLVSDVNNKLLVCYIRDNSRTLFHSHFEIFSSSDNNFEASDGRLLVQVNN